MITSDKKCRMVLNKMESMELKQIRSASNLTFLLWYRCLGRFTYVLTPRFIPKHVQNNMKWHEHALVNKNKINILSSDSKCLWLHVTFTDTQYQTTTSKWNSEIQRPAYKFMKPCGMLLEFYRLLIFPTEF